MFTHGVGFRRAPGFPVVRGEHGAAAVLDAVEREGERARLALARTRFGDAVLFRIMFYLDSSTVLIRCFDYRIM